MKRAILAVSLAILATSLTFTEVDAKRHHRHHVTRDANGNVGCKNNTIRVNTAYGIEICVDPAHASKFVKFFASLKERGCVVKEIGCQSSYGHVRGSNHLGGGACDVDQERKNVTSACMYHAGDLIREAGLYDGCAFRDCGHVEAMRGLGHYGTTRTYAARTHRRVRMARAPQPVAVARWNAL